MLIHGAVDCGVVSILDDLTLPMLTDIIAYKTALKDGDETSEAKGLSEIIKGGKI